jgi:hypothetical protein
MVARARGGASVANLMLQGGFFNNRLYFFQTFLSYLYLLSFVLHEAFLWDSSTIEPVRIFLQVIGIPAWSLPEVYAPAPPPTREFGRRFGPGSVASRICYGAALQRATYTCHGAYSVHLARSSVRFLAEDS